VFKRLLDRCQDLTYISVVSFKTLNSLARESVMHSELDYVLPAFLTAILRGVVRSEEDWYFSFKPPVISVENATFNLR
jgi:hypothetical protein